MRFLNALKCVLGASEAPFEHSYSTYIRLSPRLHLVAS